VKIALLAIASVALVLTAVACGSSEGTTPTPPGDVSANVTPLIAGGEPPFVRIATVGGKQILTDNHGMTLYVLKGDSPVYSGGPCPDECLSTWVPLLIPYGAFMTPTAGLNGPLGTFLRSGIPVDVRQVFYLDKPLYRYTGDHAPGDQSGDGAEGGNWSVAVP